MQVKIKYEDLSMFKLQFSQEELDTKFGNMTLEEIIDHSFKCGVYDECSVAKTETIPFSEIERRLDDVDYSLESLSYEIGKVKDLMNSTAKKFKEARVTVIR